MRALVELRRGDEPGWALYAVVAGCLCLRAPSVAFLMRSRARIESSNGLSLGGGRMARRQLGSVEFRIYRVVRPRLNQRPHDDLKS